MRRARLALGVLVASPLVASSCSGAGEDAPSAVDGGDVDADAGRRRNPPVTDDDDASAGDVDAALAEEDPFASGGWNPIPGTPAICKFLMAADPASLRSKWIACPSGRAGCRVLDTSWTRYPGHKLDAAFGVDPARIVDGRGMLRIRRFWVNPRPWLGQYVAYVDVIEPLDGDPLAVIGAAPTGRASDGTPLFCGLNALFGDFGVGFIGWPSDYSKSPPEDAPYMIWGWAPWTSPSAFTTASIQRTAWGPTAGGVYFIDGTMGQSRIWSSAVAPTTTALLDIVTKTPKLMDDQPFTERPLAIPGGALSFDANEPFAITFVRDDGSSTRLVTPTSPQFVTWKTLDRFGGNTLVWIESEWGLQYKNSTLWTAPVASSEAELVRRKVAKIDDLLERGGARAVANRGVFLSLVDRNVALLTRLSDGTGWRIQGEPKQRFVDPVWVDDDDVLIETAPDPDGTHDLDADGILRLSRATLGAPTVPSGL